MEQFTLCLARIVRGCLLIVAILSALAAWLIFCHPHLLLHTLRFAAGGTMSVLFLSCIIALKIR